jgi:hypothetical protein
MLLTTYFCKTKMKNIYYFLQYAQLFFSEVPPSFPSTCLNTDFHPICHKSNFERHMQQSAVTYKRAKNIKDSTGSSSTDRKSVV